ncbi:MAG: hypothetical protein LBJ67_01325 [Planctomycetaceae bacterium]|jgi:hypothetical protein|nr:hypothetical protein [Planctomycetaceae bacterium]
MPKTTIEYQYNQKKVEISKRAVGYRRITIALITLLPAWCVLTKPLSFLGIGLLSAWLLIFFLFDYLLYRIERFTVLHRHDLILVTDKLICLFDGSGVLQKSIEISNATYRYSYYAAGSTIFTIYDKSSINNTIRFSTILDHFEEVIKLFDSDFSWPPEMFD